MSGKIKPSLIAKCLVVVASLMALQLFTLPFVPKVQAATNNDSLSRAEQHARTQLYAIIRCLDEESGIWYSEQDVNSYNFYKDNNQIAVGFELDREDGNRMCKNMNYKAALDFVGMSESEFKRKLFQPDGDMYKLRDDANNVKDELIRLAERKKHTDGRTIGPEERVRRAAAAAKKCVEQLPGSDISAREVTISGKKYRYKDGKSPDSDMPVGYDFVSGGGNMKCSSLIDIVHRNNGFEKFPDAGDGGDATGGGGGNPDETEPDCDSSWSSPPSWIICPLIDLGVDMTDGVFKDIIVPMLENVPVTSNPKEGVYIAWQQFRFIANILLVGSLLAIVYSQARGGK